MHTSKQCTSHHHHNDKHRNHYELLGLSNDATKREIKSQFYKLSKLHHPDKNASETSRKEFLSINEAYSVLGNERQRRDYDLTLLDRSGSLYSSSSSRASPNRGTLRRTPFRHSAQSAAAAAAAAAAGAARTHNAFRPNSVGKGAPGFDSKTHQEMHYEQEIRQGERRRQRQQQSAEYQRQQKFEADDSPMGRLMRVVFVFVAVVVASSFMKAFADEEEREDEDEDDNNNHHHHHHHHHDHRHHHHQQVWNVAEGVSFIVLNRSTSTKRWQQQQQQQQQQQH
ncbi:hypothetical protein BG004_003985 [Podila humilis]|nr:hypothetical protein BG004_003985 [Podila humilis]